MQPFQGKISRGSKLKNMEDFQKLSTVNKKFTKNELVVKDIQEKKKGKMFMAMKDLSEQGESPMKVP